MKALLYSAFRSSGVAWLSSARAVRCSVYNKFIKINFFDNTLTGETPLLIGKRKTSNLELISSKVANKY